MLDVIVIGAGPAGTFAAISAAVSGSKTLLVEKNERIGKKVLATGNGRCNITNMSINESNYHGSVGKNLTEIMSLFSQTQTIDYFNNIGVVTKVEDRGRVFPLSDQANTVVDAIEDELKNNQVETLLGVVVKRIDKDDTFLVTLEDGRRYQSKAIVLATGGKAAHQFGSSGDGLFWAKNLGHSITEIHAALAPIEIKEGWVKEVMGNKFRSNVKAYYNNSLVASKSGDLLFTHYGVSGPAPMGIAGAIAPLIKKGEVILDIDILPDISNEQIEKMIIEQSAKYPKKKVSNILSGILPKNVAGVVTRLSMISDNENSSELSKDRRRKIISNIKSMRLTVKAIRPLKEAQVTSGGVPLSEISSTLESSIVPNLFFAGEILDIDGESGGYNLQWAWSSGKIAGENASKNANI